MQTCGEIWPDPRDSCSPAFLHVNKAATATVTPGLSHSGTGVSMINVHNKSERRRHSEMTTCRLSHAPQSPHAAPKDAHFLHRSLGRGSRARRSALRENPGSVNLSLYMRSYPSTCSLQLQSASCATALEDSDIHVKHERQKHMCSSLLFKYVSSIKNKMWNFSLCHAVNK